MYRERAREEGTERNVIEEKKGWKYSNTNEDERTVRANERHAAIL
tara:strand:- start:798 stop:932 length:135 start_codon:yes stop_codon:yes gene_type:complete